MTDTKVTFVVLSEDSGKQGWSAVHRLVELTLELLVPGLDWNNKITVAPRGDVPAAVQKICAGNDWNSSTAAFIRPKGELFRYVARLLDESTDGRQFVLFHVDADRVWSEKERNPSLNVKQFNDIVRVGVRQVLLERSRIRRTKAEMDQIMSRLALIVPYYSIEAWLYQATERACELCRQRCGRHIPRYEAWKLDRSSLEEIRQLKDESANDVHCLKDDDKDALSRVFPASSVFDSVKSYESWVNELMEHVEMMAALKMAQYA